MIKVVLDVCENWKKWVNVMLIFIINHLFIDCKLNRISYFWKNECMTCLIVYLMDLQRDLFYKIIVYLASSENIFIYKSIFDFFLQNHSNRFSSRNGNNNYLGYELLFRRVINELFIFSCFLILQIINELRQHKFSGI